MSGWKFWPLRGGGGVWPLMEKTILNFHFDYLTTSLRWNFLFIILLLKPFFNWTSKIRPYFDPSALTHHLIFGEGSEWQKSVRFEFQLSDLWLFDENGFSARLSIYKPHLDLYSALCKSKDKCRNIPLHRHHHHHHHYQHLHNHRDITGPSDYSWRREEVLGGNSLESSITLFCYQFYRSRGKLRKTKLRGENGLFENTLTLLTLTLKLNAILIFQY